MSAKLVVGQEVTILIPFTYTIGEEGNFSNKVLNTIEDCKNEVKAELDENNINSSNVYLKVQDD